MGRSISQIYSEAVFNRNNYLQLTEMDSGILNRKGKMSILNLFTYVMSVLIYTYETILDVFEINIARLLSQRINGTPEYYAMVSKKYQFNSSTQAPDKLVFDEGTLKIGYETVDTSHQIIKQSAWEYSIIQTTNDNDEAVEVRNGIVLKVCKNSSSSEDEAAVYEPLSAAEMTGFRNFINQIKFLGAKISCVSTFGDILTIANCTITYNKDYINEDQAFESVKSALIKYAKSLDYNGYIYYQAIIDAIQSADNVLDVSNGTEVYLTSFDTGENAYGEPVAVSGRVTAYSGYVTFIDANGQSTINKTNLTFVGISPAQE